MTAFSEPTKWAQSLGATANADVIPDEAGATDVDISKIFPAVFSVPLSQGGKAIPRRTLNGIFKTLGDWSFYNQNGGVPSYNADFDYTVGRLVSYNGSLYKCIQANDHTAPHNPTDKDYWVELSDSSDIDNIATDIDNIATDLSGKADRSLSNVDNTAKIAIAHNAMPSDTTLALTVGASGTYYTMPADGYIIFNGVCATHNYVGTMAIYVGSILYSSVIETDPNSAAPHIATFAPVRKGASIQIGYNPSSFSSLGLTFVYANGSISEA